ncbi:MAG: response regulator, partial [Aestuariivirga sp.]
MKKPTLFVVDDEEAVRKSLGSVLSTYDFVVQAFDSAEAALSSIGKLKPACIIADIRMPGMDGLTFQRILSESSNSPPVILITGHGDVSMAVRA